MLAHQISIEVTPCDEKPFFEMDWNAQPHFDLGEHSEDSSTNPPLETLQLPDTDTEEGIRGRLGSFKNLLKEMSPKNVRRRRKSHQPLRPGSIQLQTRSKSVVKLASPNGAESSRFWEKRHSFDGLLRDVPYNLDPEGSKFHKRSLFSSVKNLLSISRSSSAHKLHKGNSMEETTSKHIRQNSDSLLLVDPTRYEELINEEKSKNIRLSKSAMMILDTADGESYLSLVILTAPPHMDIEVMTCYKSFSIFHSYNCPSSMSPYFTFCSLVNILLRL